VIGRLQTIGFDKITVTADAGLRFAAAKPPPEPTAGQQPRDERGQE
jgi:hypothetical protein